MKHRLYHPPPILSGMTLTLDRERAHYLTHVLRLRRGTDIECFDGAGRAWQATFTDADRRSAQLRIGAQIVEQAPPQPPLHLAQGVLKGAAMDAVVQKATELGATDLWPVLAARSNVPADEQRQQRKHAHWLRVLESAAEQCGAVHLPRLHAQRTLTAFLEAAGDLQPVPSMILLDPDAPVLPLTLPRSAVALLVGPEGGWTDAERREAADRGAVSHGLGRRVLRGETAPLAVLAALRHGWGWT